MNRNRSAHSKLNRSNSITPDPTVGSFSLPTLTFPYRYQYITGKEEWEANQKSEITFNFQLSTDEHPPPPHITYLSFHYLKPNTHTFAPDNS